MDIKKKVNDGFTLIEILVAITMAAIIFIAVLALMQAVMGSSRKTKMKQTIEQTKNDLLIDISNNTKWAEAGTLEVPGDPEEGWIRVGDELEYRLDKGEGRIQRNGEYLTSKNIVIEDFIVSQHSDSSLEMEINMMHNLNPDFKDSIVIIVSPRNRGEEP